ncbi:MAG: hypothetical protein ACP5G7_01525 [Anaerolineae bacterium]
MLDAWTASIAGLAPGSWERIGAWVAALITCAVLSYAITPNPVARAMQFLLAGIAAGYATAQAWDLVLWPRVQLLLQDPRSHWTYGVFMVLGILLLARGIKPLAVIANLPLGILFGGGAALALGGALAGTLAPQLRASMVSMAPRDYGGGIVGWAYAIDAALLLMGTIAALAAFQFTSLGKGKLGRAWQSALQGLGALGRAVIMVAFGVVYAGAMVTFFGILVSRLTFLAGFVASLSGGG